MNDETSDEFDLRMAPHLEYLGDRMNLLFAYHFCVVEFEGDERLDEDVAECDRAWMLKTIQNACLHTSLIALRDIDDFFSPKKSKPDDLRALDYGMTGSRQFLAVDERNSINTLIAHTTTHGASKVGYRWDILELTSKAVAQCDTFLQWIMDYYSLEHFNIWTAAATIQAKTKAVLKWVQGEARRRNDKTDCM